MKTTDYRAMMIFDKQIEFFDKLMPVLHEVNCYITALDVWSGETGKRAGKLFKIALTKNACLKKLQKLLGQYSIYFPKHLSNEANKLHLHCMMLQNSQAQDAIAVCTELLLTLQENIRKHIHTQIKGAC